MRDLIESLQVMAEDSEEDSLLKKLGDPKVDLNQFAVGLKVESEHKKTVGGDMVTVAKIVLDHLAEDPKYYDKLTKAGL